ncbi:hypothetical protein SASPL_144781 [Salvia splendens]|uniref:Aminotransferase-like plant mobile domain-containing protein n=1 Tax=Salvia splendens TaxID=180675 RepID=A0A8X8WFF1_SALSN|nr:hypothetical protein SASPL_144781 [Salvia splendens]
MASDLEVNTESTEPTHSEKRKIDLIDSERRSKRRNDQEKLVASETRGKRQNEKQTEVKEQKKGNNYFSKRLLVKRKPLFFVEAISKLNEAQINSVKEMGFESVLDFKIDSIPITLAFSLLKSFDKQECDINLCREKWKRNARFMRKLAEESDSKPGNVKHKAVQQLMLADHEGGPQFKRLFLVLLESALIEPSTYGMIKSKLGDVIDDLDSVRNINWCSYTISVLKFAMKNWSKTEKNAFAGPLPFLMLCYLDRVLQDKCPVPRTFPLMKGWKSEHLQAREDNEISE